MFSWRMMKLLKSWSGRESSRRNSQSVTNAEIYCDSVACFTTAALEASWDGEVALGCLSAFQCWLPSFLASSFNSKLVLFGKGQKSLGKRGGRELVRGCAGRWQWSALAMSETQHGEGVSSATTAVMVGAEEGFLALGNKRKQTPSLGGGADIWCWTTFA